MSVRLDPRRGILEPIRTIGNSSTEGSAFRIPAQPGPYPLLGSVSSAWVGVRTRSREWPPGSVLFGLRDEHGCTPTGPCPRLREAMGHGEISRWKKRPRSQDRTSHPVTWPDCATSVRSQVARCSTGIACTISTRTSSYRKWTGPSPGWLAPGAVTGTPIDPAGSPATIPSVAASSGSRL
jgi:hypothetical protein